MGDIIVHGGLEEQDARMLVRDDVSCCLGGELLKSASRQELLSLKTPSHYQPTPRLLPDILLWYGRLFEYGEIRRVNIRYRSDSGIPTTTASRPSSQKQQYCIGNRCLPCWFIALVIQFPSISFKTEACMQRLIEYRTAGIKDIAREPVD